MSETAETLPADPQPRTLAGIEATSKRRSIVKSSEMLLIAVVVLVVGIGIVTVVSKATTQRDTADAQAISDQAIAGVQKRNGATVRQLGSASFKKSYSAAELTSDFNHIEVATLKPPTLAQHFTANTASGKSVVFIYEYTALKVPYYMRAIVQNNAGQWQLSSLSGSANESSLLGSN